MYILITFFFIKAKSYDERHFVFCKIYDNYGIAKSDKDQGIVARKNNLLNKLVCIK